MSKQVQAQKFTLSGSGVSASATTIALVTLATPDGTAITMTDFGSDVGYATLEPGTAREESISFTGISSLTLTGVSRGLRFVSPFDVVAGNKKAHAGGTVMVFSNTSAFYSRFVDDFNAQTIAGIKTFSSIPVLPASDPTTSNQAARKAYVDLFMPLTGGTFSGAVAFNSTVLLAADPTLALQAATKQYVDGVAVAGAPNASTTVKGIVEEATQAEVNAGTATGGTGARLYVNPSTLSVPLLASDGSAGAVTINSGTTTLTADTYYSSLTVNGTGTLNTGGYKVFVNGTCTVDTSGGGGGIHNKGGAGAAGSGATGGAAGSAAGTGSGAACIAGAAGGAGGTAGNGTAGTAGTASTFNIVTSAGSAGGTGGGGGGGGSPGAGGVGGANSSTAAVKLRDIVTASFPFQFTSATAVQRANVSPSAGGGGGGGGNSGPGGGGGGSGASGGHLFLACKTLAITGTGAINVNGGAGGNGANNTGGGGGGGGGGAGGNGGVATVIYFSKSGTGTITAAAGAAGTFGLGGQGGGGGSDGAAGTAGSAGIVIEITV